MTTEAKTERPKVHYDISAANTAPCRGCGVTIYWIKTQAGKNMPCDSDGTPHWATCKRAKDFKGSAK